MPVAIELVPGKGCACDGPHDLGTLCAGLPGPDVEFFRRLAVLSGLSVSPSLPIRSDAMPWIAVHDVPHRLASDVVELLSFDRSPAAIDWLREDAALLSPNADADLEGCLLGRGEAEREPIGVWAGEAIRFIGAVIGSKATSSPSSSPEISLGALGRKEDDAGVELVREVLPWVEEMLFMAVRGSRLAQA